MKSAAIITFLKKHWIKILIGLLILFALSGGVKKLKRWYWRRNASASGVDTSDPYGDALRLYTAMKSNAFDPSTWGTDEAAIWDVLEGKSPDHLAAIYNEFGQILAEKNETGDLFSWFSEDLDGADLDRAMGYFDGVNVI